MTNENYQWMKRCEIVPQFPVQEKALLKYLPDSITNAAIYKVPYYLMASLSQATPTPSSFEKVLWDPCLQEGHFESYDFTHGNVLGIIDTHCLPGVTDNPGRSLAQAFELFDIDCTCYSGNLYFVTGQGELSKADLKPLSLAVHNPLIEAAVIMNHAEFSTNSRFEAVSLPNVHIHHDVSAGSIDLNLDDQALLDLSSKMCLALNLNEMKAIKAYYEDEENIRKRADKGLSPYPTDVELEVLAQTWSEHCKHKIFASRIDYTNEETGEKEVIDSLYKSYIKKSTKDIEASGVDWLVSVFSDNAGIVRFDQKIDLCIKVETHNSPSALDPYGGAITGILGVNRDILGCGLGAKPIANTDVFCFASTELPQKISPELLPAGLMEPAALLKGVHKGVEDGGNKSGIPTINGAIQFDSSYAGKPLVFCGTIGTLPAKLPDGRESKTKGAKSGDLIIVSGGGVGADGIHGATFSSMELNEDSPATAVQIGDPITQKRVMDFLLEARDLGLFTCVTDNGAGGIASSIGEMAELTGGARIDLAKHPTKYPGLAPWEIMISESQERMTFAVDPKNRDRFLELSRRRGVTSSVLGEFTDSGSLEVFYEDKLVADLEMNFLHDGVPQLELEAKWSKKYQYQSWLNEEKTKLPESKSEICYQLLRSENIASKEHWVRQYDHEVQGATLVKPFSGVNGIGPDDSGLIDLSAHGGEEGSMAGVSCAIAPRWSLVNPNMMTKIAVDEAMRNLVSCGINPAKVCLLDNFCWPDPVKSEKNNDGDYKLGQLVETCKGLYDISTLYKAPLVSGKDSMKNDFRGKNRRGDDVVISIKPTLLVTAMGHGETKNITRSHASVGQSIYRIGPKYLSFHASEVESQFSGIELDQNPEKWSFEVCQSTHHGLYDLINQGHIESCHDISDGGMLCALTEMLFDAGLGLKGKEGASEMSLLELFGEGPGQYMISVDGANVSQFEKSCRDKALEIEEIGLVNDSSVIEGAFLGSERIEISHALKQWQRNWK